MVHFQHTESVQGRRIGVIVDAPGWDHTPVNVTAPVTTQT